MYRSSSNIEENGMKLTFAHIQRGTGSIGRHPAFENWCERGPEALALDEENQWDSCPSAGPSFAALQLCRFEGKTAGEGLMRKQVGSCEHDGLEVVR